MSSDRGCLVNSLLFLVIVFLPVIGQLVVTAMIFEEKHSFLGTILWLIITWAIPFLGPFMYLLFGQQPERHGRVMFGQPSYAYSPPQHF